MRVQSQFIEMFGNHSTTPVSHYIAGSYPGEWGMEDKDGSGVKVIRTTNFTNAGKLDLTDVVTRSIIEKKVKRKTIKKFDTILERSGGTAENPVGRVVLFEEDDQYLCNNFTQVLRFKDIDPRYAFYSLFYYYQMNKTAVRSMGSKTTGIQNLDMNRYLEIGIPNASDYEQSLFIAIAEQADKSKFVSFKSQFIEMFGDVEKKPFVDVCISKGEYGSNSPADDYDGNIRYVRITDITEEGNLNGVVVSPRKVEEKYMLLQDDLLFARTGNTVGKTYLHKNGKMIFAGYLIRYRLNKKLMLPQFAFAYTHTNQYYDWVEKIKKVGAQPNISAAQYDSMPIPVPSMAKQIEFVAITKQADKSKYNN